MSTFYVIDFDRTLVNTEKLYDVLDTVLERLTDIDVGMINVERVEIEARGESFKLINTLDHLLRASKGSVNWLDVERAFIKEARETDGILEPYATDLLKSLDDRHIPYGILTYGNEAWQLTKVEAADLINVPHLVTRIKEKGQLLAGWKHGDLFVIPPAMTKDFQPLTVDSIVFLDDKAVSFQDIPEGVRGICVRSPFRELLPSQRGDLPSGVETVSGLNEAVELLFK
jgi:hypothetical protein